MAKNIKELIEETRTLNKEIKDLKQNLRDAEESIGAINAGKVDALVISNEKQLKVFTDKTADKTYRILIEKMHEGAVTLNKEATILYCNSRFADIVNLPLQKVIGTTFKNFIDDSSKEQFEILFKQGWEKNITEEVSIYTSERKVIPVLVSVNMLSLDDNSILSIILTDITERKKNESRLELLASIVESTDDAIVSKSMDGTINSWNKGSEKLFGYSEKEIVGKNISLIIPPENIDEEKKIFEKISKGETIKYETNRNKKNGEQIDVSITVSPLKDTKGNIIGASKIAHNISNLKKAEAELIRANKELAFQNQQKEKRATELSTANKELAFQNEEKEKRAEELSIANKDLTTFTFVSSHDLQEPLRKIKNYVTVLLKEEEKNLSPTGKNYLQNTYDTSKKMQELIEDLLTYARTKDSDRKFDKTNITTILDEVKKEFEGVIQEKKVVIDAANLCEANIIRFQFRQLFQNLISNSIKFSKPLIAPHIIIKSEIVEGSKLNNEKLSSDRNYCHITYTDNGIGFDPQYNEKVFEVFQRLHSKEEYEGTGIGLAICKRIIENHKGIITATGEVNKGVQFDIYIPVC